MVTLGVIVFAASSAMCGLTPKGSLAEAWIVTFRVVQGAGGAIMFPAALAIVVQTFELRERGKALAIFFGIAGGLTAVGPILGGYLTQWTWRAIFWVNIPVAIIALVLIVSQNRALASTGSHGLPRPGFDRLRRRPECVRLSAVLHLGLERSRHGGVHRDRRGAAGGVLFRRASHRLAADRDDIFRIRAFLVENLVLAISMLVFVPVFFFASEYAQIALGKSPSEAGLTSFTSSSASSSLRRSVDACSTGWGASVLWYSAAR